MPWAGRMRISLRSKRMAFPAEIAEAVVFLVDAEAAHITGADLAIDAGYTAG